MTIRAGNIAKLPDGRALGYDECGDPEGAPVVVFHGTPGSRVGWAGPDQDAVAEQLGVRLIAPDRPGHGLSAARADRTIQDWAVDIAHLGDALGMSRFHVLGAFDASGYVAACALRIPHRLRAAGIVSGTRPIDAVGAERASSSTAERWVPGMMRRRIRKLGEKLASHPNTMIEQHLATLPPVDQALWREPRRRQLLIDSWREAFRPGFEGPYLDFRLAAQPWGFSLADVPMVINLWFGEQSAEAAADGRYLAGAFQRSETRVFPDEGEWSPLINRLGDVLTGLLATGERQARSRVG